MSLVWYVAYGSNLLKSRFMKYINGDPNSADPRKREGCRDKTPPEVSVRTTVPYALYYGNSSSNWGGCGAAFLDTTKSAYTPARAWLVKEEQFETIRVLEGMNPRWYGRKIELGTICGIPALTFTYVEKPFANKPSDAYKATMAEGFREMIALSYCEINTKKSDAFYASRSKYRKVKKVFKERFIFLSDDSTLRTYDEDAEKLEKLLGITGYRNKKGLLGLCIRKNDLSNLLPSFDNQRLSLVVLGKGGVEYECRYSACVPSNTDSLAVCPGMYIEVRDNNSGETKRWHYMKPGENIRKISVDAENCIIFTDVPITELNGYDTVTPDSPLAGIINGKHIGDEFSCNGYSYRITNISDYEFK